MECATSETKLISMACTENEIVGEALIALRHEELKEMAIISVGHRLMILKGVYDVKIKQDITIDSDHWIPPCKLLTFVIFPGISDTFLSRRRYGSGSDRHQR